MNQKLRVLILEDQPTDAELVLRELRRAGCEPEWTRVMTEPDFLAQLGQDWEIILADYSMPQFTGLRALELLKARGLDIPFVLISGTVGEDVAVEAMKSGASDYLMKGHLARLGQVVERELRDAAGRREQRRLETAMNASEVRYRRLFEASKDGILILNGETGRIVDVNPFLAELLGYARGKFIGQQLWDLGFFRDIVANQDNFAELQAKDYIRYDDLALETSDGRRIEVEFVSNAYLVASYRVIQCNIRDITERKRAEAAMRESEERYRALFERSIDCVFLNDFDGRFLDANPAALDLLGYRREDIPTLTFASLLTEDQLPLASQVNEEIKTTGHQKELTEFRLRGKDGRQVEVEVQSALIYRAGKPYAIQGIARDLTERKRAAADLASERTLLRTLVDHLPLAVYLKDTAGRKTLANPLDLRNCGISTETEIRGKTDSEIFPGSQSATFATDDLQVLQGKPVLNREEQLTRPDGTNFWLLTSKVPLHDVTGRVTGLAGFGLDITERKRAEATLQLSEERLRLATEGSGIGVWNWEVITDVVHWSDQCRKLFGMTPEERMDYPHFLEILHPDDRARIDQAVHAALNQRVTYDVEYRIRWPDGSFHWLAAKGRAYYDDQGQATRMEGVVLDIAERKRVEEAHLLLATAVEQAAETIVITNADGTIVYANPAFEQATGYTRAEALGQNPRMLQSGKHDADFYRRMWDVLDRGEVWSGHMINKRKDGSLYEEEATITPVRNAAGKVINYVAVKRDVTHEMQLEAQFRQTQKMEAIGTLAGGIAHDFNNILASIFGNGYLLQQDTAGNPETQEYVNEVLKAASRAKELVSQILTFSRQRELSRQVIRLDTVIKEATKFLRASLPAHIEIEMQLAADAPAVLADPTQIYQVALNLATNALHAMAGRPGRLTVALDRFQPTARFLEAHPEFRPVPYARVLVADTGQGMDARTLERIFEPFFTTKPVGQGTGLGLAVVHGIVQSHEGIITVTSAVGQGTTFSLYFPAQTDPVAVTDPAAVKIPAGHGQRILLVDDEPALTEVFQRILSRLQYQVTVCNQAREAVALFRENPAAFDLVITDLTMPEMSGLEVARQLHALRPDLPVILASGYSSNLNPEELQEAGICELLEKTVSPASLGEAVHRALA